MALTKQDKTKQIKEIEDLINSSSIIIAWDYLGLKVNDLVELKKDLKKLESISKVYKNRVAKIAFKNTKKEEIIDYLVGPSSFLFINSEDFQAINLIKKLEKKFENKTIFKVGYISGDFYDSDKLNIIANLPSKDGLLSMLLSVLQANQRNLANVISQVSDKKE